MTVNLVCLSRDVCWADELRRANVESQRVIQCRSPDELRSLLSRQTIDGAALDLPFAAAILEPNDLRERLVRLPILLRTRITEAIAGQLAQLARWFPDASVSLKGPNDSSPNPLITWPFEPDPTFRILTSCRAETHASASPIVAAVVVLGRKRTHVAEFAKASCIPVRTIEHRLNRCRLPCAGTLFGWSLALHTMWRLEYLSWPLKRCASVAGVADADALAEYLKRHVGRRPRSLLCSGGFEALLAHWSALFYSSCAAEVADAVIAPPAGEWRVLEVAPGRERSIMSIG